MRHGSGPRDIWRRHRAGRAGSGLPLVVVLAAGAAGGGCASGNDAPVALAADRPGARSTAASGTAPATLASVAAAVERRYVIGPAAAREIGYRIDWQFPARTRIQQLLVRDDSVFALDENNFLLRLRREEGDRVWRIPVASEIERIFGIIYMPTRERVYLMTGGDILVLDAASGSRIAKQRLDKTANTSAIVVGQFLVYGSRSGQLVWHSFALDSDWRGYQISPSIQIPPVYADDHIIAVGSDGRVMCLRAGSATQVWSKKALAGIEVPPAVGNGAVYVASLDQHLRAYEITARRTPLWEYLTESPLTDPPVLVGDRVYQSVASEGLVCLEALPLDSPGGVVVWRAADARGTVLTQRRGNLLTWNAREHRLLSIDAMLGAVVTSYTFPHLDTIRATGVDEGDLYATATDGRIIRLVPRR